MLDIKLENGDLFEYLFNNYGDNKNQGHFKCFEGTLKGTKDYIIHIYIENINFTSSFHKEDSLSLLKVKEIIREGNRYNQNSFKIHATEISIRFTNCNFNNVAVYGLYSHNITYNFNKCSGERLGILQAKEVGISECTIKNLKVTDPHNPMINVRKSSGETFLYMESDTKPTTPRLMLSNSNYKKTIIEIKHNTTCNIYNYSSNSINYTGSGYEITTIDSQYRKNKHSKTVKPLISNLTFDRAGQVTIKLYENIESLRLRSCFKTKRQRGVFDHISFKDNGRLELYKTYLRETEFKYVNFSNFELREIDCYFGDSQLTSCIWSPYRDFYKPESQIENTVFVQKQGFYNNLKDKFSKMNAVYEAGIFYQLEQESLLKHLEHTKDNDRWILQFNKLTSNFGTDVVQSARVFIFLNLFMSLILFSIDSKILQSPIIILDYINHLINPFSKIEHIHSEHKNLFIYKYKILITIFRFFNAALIYQITQTFRKYSRKI